MKSPILKTSLITSLAISVSILQGMSQDAQTTEGSTVTTRPASGPVKMPYGVEDVLKLSRAQVSEDVILTYIQNTGTIYNLGPKDIVYLKEQGVSDRIVNAMIDQKRIASEMAAQAQQQQAIAQQQAAAAADNAPITTPAYSESEPAPASTLYVIPYPTPAYPRYSFYAGSYCYPYPYSYYGYGYGRPVIGFRFGVGGHGFHSHSYHSYHYRR